MSVETLRAAKALGHFSDWSLSNLQMQKILYFAHMFFLGRTKDELVVANFEAWDFGPVLPSLYQKIKFFANDKIIDIFPGKCDFNESAPEIKILKDAALFFKNKSAGELVALSHHEKGAWAKNYRLGVRGNVIPTEDILQEYNALYA